VLQGLKVQLEIQVLLVQLALKAQQELKAQLVLEVLLVLLEQQELKALQVFLDQQVEDLQDHKVTQEHKELLGLFQ
jgi:hypothetical protein